jgi:hypothetical protein
MASTDVLGTGVRDATDHYISGFPAGIDRLVAHEGVLCVCGGGFFANLKNEATRRVG